MRVLWVASEFAPQIGGIQTYISALTTELVDLGHQVGLITGPGQHASRDGLEFHTALPLARPASSAEWRSNRERLASHVHAFRPEIVHFGSAGLAVYHDAIPREIPIVVTVHGKDLTAPWQLVPGEADVAARIVRGLEHAAVILTLSAATARAVRDRLRPVEVTRLPPGCPIPREACPARPDGAPTVLTVGRLIARKGHLNLLEGLELASHDLRWVVVGEGPFRGELETAVARSKLRERVTLLGAVSGAVLAECYATATIFALTPVVLSEAGKTDFEGFGLVYHEAAAFALPAIASDAVGCKEAVLDGRTGLLVQPESPQDIARAIDRLLGDDQLRRELGCSARAHVQALGGWPRLARDVERLYRRVKERNNDRASV